MPKDNNPKFSILVPIRNVAPYIADTIESTLSQSFKDWELIIMDGASTDGTVEIIMDYAKKDKRIRAYSEPDESPWHAVDKMFDLARGEYISIVCGQDGFYNDKWLEKAARVLDNDQSLSLVWALGQGVTLSKQVITEPDAYSHFMGETKGETARNLFHKVLRILWDMISGSWQRKKYVFGKLFSKSAFLTANTFIKRTFPDNKPPQKEEWFCYWLNNGMVFPDQSMIINKKVFLNCVPRYEMGSKTLGYMTDFFYNFNAKGYLAYFIPIFAIFTRMHEAASGERQPDEMYQNSQKYLNDVRLFRKKLFKKHLKFTFIDKDGKPVSSKQF